MKIHLDWASRLASVAFSFIHNLARVLEFWEVTLRPWNMLWYIFSREYGYWYGCRGDGRRGSVCECPQWPENVHGWSVCGPVWSTMTDELAVDLGGLGDSLSVCDSRGAPCALTSLHTVIEFTILHHSSQVYTPMAESWEPNCSTVALTF